MRSNCIFWSIALYNRRRRKGREGYLMIRATRLGLGPHFLYAEMRRTGTLRLVSFKPIDGRDKKWPPPVFVGKSRWGDFADTKAE